MSPGLISVRLNQGLPIGLPGGLDEIGQELKGKH